MDYYEPVDGLIEVRIPNLRFIKMLLTLSQRAIANRVTRSCISIKEREEYNGNSPKCKSPD